MRKAVFAASWLFAAVCLLAAPARGALKLVYAGGPVELSPGKTNVLLVGEEAVLNTGAKMKGKVECEVEGGALKLAVQTGDAGEGRTCTFQAAQSGKAVVIKKTSLFGQRWLAPKTRIEARVMALDELPEVKLADLARDPHSYMGRVFRLSGTSRGWGLPEKAKEVWGRRVTKSDWVLEDDTGAVNVTGSIVLDNGPVVVVAELYELEGQWGVRSRQVYAVEKEPLGVPADYVDLDPDKLNVLKVGQVGRMALNLSRSDVPDIEIEGDAVSPVKTVSLDYFYRADKPGEAVIKVSIRFFLDVQVPEPPPVAIGAPSPPKPRKVYRIKVVAP
jgi:hypothetical protein